MSKTKQLENKKIENKKDSMVTIKLLCDVFYWNGKVQKWTVLKIKPQELKKFPESFYEKK